MKRTLAVAAGCISFGLGVAGIFVPLLPTTPFLLLSAWLWLKSSDRLYRWLIRHKLFGKYIRDYTERKTVPVGVKAVTLVLMWASMLFCIFRLLAGKAWLQILLFLIAVGVSWHVIRLGNGGGSKKEEG